MRTRVVAYVVRERDGRRELLVFDEEGHPEIGSQVPAGGVEPGERLEEAVRREVGEEAGVDCRIVRKLGVHDYRAPDGIIHHSHFFEARSDDNRETWTHAVGGEGEDRGFAFLCRWKELRPGLTLAGEQDWFLRELAAP